MTRTRISGTNDWTLAAMHRPSDPAELRAVAVDLRARGLTPRDIAAALTLTESAVIELLDARPAASNALCPRTGIPMRYCTCIGPHDHD